MRIFIISLLYLSLSLFSREKESGTRDERCLDSYHENCRRVIDGFKRTYGGDFHWQRDIYSTRTFPWQQGELLRFTSEYSHFEDHRELSPTFTISGLDCNQVNSIEMSYRTRIGEYGREVHPPSLNVNFEGNSCQINQVLVRPLGGQQRVLTQEICTNPATDPRIYGVVFFEACQMIFNVEVPYRIIDYRTPVLTTDCVDCESQLDGSSNANSFISSHTQALRSAFLQEQERKQSSESTAQILARVRSVILEGNNSDKIYRALNELINLMPLNSALELLLEIPQINSSPYVMHEYISRLAGLYLTREDRFGEIFPEQAYLDRKRVYNKFVALMSLPNQSNTMKTHLIHSSFEIIQNSSDPSFEFDRFMPHLIRISQTTQGRSLTEDGINSMPYNIITSNIKRVVRKDTKLNLSQRESVLSILNNMLAGGDDFDKGFVYDGINQIMLLNFVKDSSEENMTRILSSISFKGNNFNPYWQKELLANVDQLTRSEDPIVIQRALRLKEYLSRND